MHTAICAFKDSAAAQRAADRLVAAGFPRPDVHLEYRQAEDQLIMEGEGAAPRDKPAPNDAWDGLEREIAVDKRVLEKFGRFFSILFGRDEHGHADTYARHLEGGSVVVVVDAHDEARAEQATLLLQEMEATDAKVVLRTEQRPLREIVDERAGLDLKNMGRSDGI
jgi:hypothetical protein